ncbi:MAG TPA: Asp23/Gls24 family envelope stress response protein [Pseudobacteroides sp.]|nr:Asp23/Gls24 family envelope stress response protein [Pseudobacteroides sp.]
MRVVGFIGPSGTGKSHRATWVAKERGIDFIIDDGILIRGNRIVAGRSAKREATKIASVKCALFQSDEHAHDVKRALELYKPSALLILGTSEGMVEKIASRLEVGPVNEKIYITDVASEFEINLAKSTRMQQGKHVIPVPTFEIKKDFSGYFLDPLQIFKRKGKGSYQLVGEKSVVRPTFSYLGKYTISDYTVYQIIEHVVSKIEGVSRISRFRAENHPDGIYIEMDLILIYGYIIKPLLRKIQKDVSEEVERLTALNIKALNLVAKSLVIDPQKIKSQMEK